MASRWARVARGLLASGVAIFVAALFHIAGGGSAPSPVSLGLSLAFATLASIALTGRRLSLWRLTAAVAVSQVLFHLLFSLGGGPVSLSPTGGSVVMSHMQMGSRLLLSTAGGMGRHADMGALPTSGGMWLSHAAAILVTVIALRFGERTFWGLLETTRLTLGTGIDLLMRRLAVAPVALVLPIARPVESELSRLRDLGLLVGCVHRRGPPSACCAY